MSAQYRAHKVGDKVRIVSAEKLIRIEPFLIDIGLGRKLEFCGRIATITKVFPHLSEYAIDLDEEQAYTWKDIMFEKSIIFTV
jgi:hypothetical protein